jgi:hypothetical protein
MATDLKLTANHDLSITGGDIDLATEGTEVAQSVKIRLLFVEGEWVLDYTQGVPWIDVIFSMQYSTAYKELTLRDVINTTDGIRNLKEFFFETDPNNRGATVSFTAETDFADIIVEVKQ